MKKFLLISGLAVMALTARAQQAKVEWVSTSQTDSWKNHSISLSSSSTSPDVEIKSDKPLQTIEGFGTCFNEMGWASLNVLSLTDREHIFKDFFAPNIGANFTICRMPVGANDFSLDWYSYNETAGDFEMKNFSIANDLKTLVPFIKTALQFNPALKLWASPWSPPTWMKYNKHYALARPRPDRFVENGLKPEQLGKEGTDMFIQQEKYFKSYSLYFSKFIDAYKQQGIAIGMVMPQNEFNSVQMFPSCTWTAKGLSRFVSYLGPEMQKRKVDIFFGTMERPNEQLVDTVLKAPESGKYIKGIGFQWAGKKAIPGIHQRYPKMPLYQTEQECGDGKNDWKFCLYSWELMKHYLTNGASAYMYWNTSLQQGGVSRWGWKQNSLISVDTTAKTYKYNYEYYLMKHLSHYVKPGAKRLETSGKFADILAFLNPDKSVVVVAHNDTGEAKEVAIKVGNRRISPVLPGDSFNTFLLK